MKKYLRFFKLTALLLLVTFAFSGCGLLNIAGVFTNNTNQGNVLPSNAPVSDPYYTEDIYYSEDFTQSAIITNPDNTTTTIQGTTASQQSSSVETTEGVKPDTTQPVTPDTSAPAEETTINTFEDGDYLANVQDVLFNAQDETTARKILTTAGFDYDPIQDVYYTQIDSWQRNFGFNNIYDMAAPQVGMIYSKAKIYFTYDNKDWMMEIWKGQYGITAGAEIGFYNKPTDRVMKHFDCVTDEEMLTMSFDFYNMDEFVFSRGPEKHWWLTGFKFLHVGIPLYIDLDMTIEFPNRKMANAFEGGLKKEMKNQLTDPITYTRDGNNFNVKW